MARPALASIAVLALLSACSGGPRYAKPNLTMPAHFVEAAAAGFDAARQSIIAETAQAYFSLRAEHERMRVQMRNVTNLEENQRLLDARFDAGRGNSLDVERSRTLLLSTRARVPQTESSIVRD